MSKDQRYKIAKQKASERHLKKENLTQTDIDDFCIDKIPFKIWSNLRFTSDNPDWTEKHVSTTTPQDAYNCLVKYYMFSEKCTDVEKLFPRQDRIDLLIKELDQPGSTTPPAGLNKASWKHSTPKKYKYTFGETVKIGSKQNENHFLVMLPDELYEAYTDTQLVALEKYHIKNGVTTGETRPLPPMTTVESFYLLFVQAHVSDNFQHFGRDTTTERINKVQSSTFAKELVAELVRHCPYCRGRDNLDARAATVAGTAKTKSAKRGFPEDPTSLFMHLPKKRQSTKQCYPACKYNYTNVNSRVMQRNASPSPLLESSNSKYLNLKQRLSCSVRHELSTQHLRSLETEQDIQNTTSTMQDALKLHGATSTSTDVSNTDSGPQREMVETSSPEHSSASSNSNANNQSPTSSLKSGPHRSISFLSPSSHNHTFSSESGSDTNVSPKTDDQAWKVSALSPDETSMQNIQHWISQQPDKNNTEAIDTQNAAQNSTELSDEDAPSEPCDMI